ncbi:hypothetical protein HY634_01385 [Candidatus Uhrbacteria bacterium]|nr:hypothetical protein [Candidatus Uhrbacteria bacterium]
MSEPTPEIAPGALERVTQQLESPPIETVGVQEAERSTVAPAVATAAPEPVERPSVTPKTPLREDIEEALSDGLRVAYAALTPQQQATFREHAERLAAMIEAMMTSGTLDIKRVHDGLVAWLKLNPKANIFFLMQEAKVKTDAILALAARARGQ